jgi:hypothetical protein
VLFRNALFWGDKNTKYDHRHVVVLGRTGSEGLRSRHDAIHRFQRRQVRARLGEVD